MCNKKLKFQQVGNATQSSRKQDLHMGTSVCLQSGTEACSVGGFLLLPDGDIGFITCAHNFTDTSIGEDVYQQHIGPDDNLTRSR